MKDLLLWAALAIIVLGTGSTVACLRYRECRSHGFSQFYCLTQK